MTSVYLDHNATSPIRPEVIQAVTHAMTVGGNASAPHSHGRAVGKLVSDARESVALAMGVCAQDLIFTGSGTEADNMAIHAAHRGGCKRLLISAMDHPATYDVAAHYGIVHEIIPTNTDGVVDMGWLDNRLQAWDNQTDGRPFVSLVAANSETGVIQPFEDATDLVHGAGGLILIDAVQALGKLPMTYMADYIAVSAHKIGGPQGVGALYVSPDAPMSPSMIGGGQERRRRAGTLNVAGIAGFGAAARVATDLGHTQDLRDYVEAHLKAMEPDITIFGEKADRLPNTSFFAVPDANSTTLMMALDLSGVSVSTGMACSSGKVGPNRTLRHMGQDANCPNGPIRISFGYNNTQDDADAFLSAWAKIRRKDLPLQGAA
ncbi:cysteine desulfurase family protein [Fretibacter rubidus]|uniref:cysteine desulfurase family protein n=1 Tax=Fretibacter rubidus TaxID=570162 RepID=UPI00352B6A9F